MYNFTAYKEALFLVGVKKIFFIKAGNSQTAEIDEI
jgi:hypothetical protein